jgi:hypothetical protein
MMKGTNMKTLPVFSCFLFAALALSIQAGPVQDAIQAAAGSGLVELPAGEYRGPISLPDGFTLVGAGAGQTILDGEGAATVVSMGNNAALIGCTVRNGQIGIRSVKAFVGVFECEVSGIVREGIRLDSGSACLVNNAIDCGPAATGIVCSEANPYVNRNVIRNHKIGVLVSGPLAPVLQANVFQSNETAVVVQAGASVEMTGNVFDGNGTAIAGQDLAAGNEIRAATAEELLLAKGTSWEGCRDMMQLVSAQSISAHPLVQYNLSPELGRFYLAILHPSASFTILASAPDTIIESYDAYDGLTDADLKAHFVHEGAYSGVAVVNPEIQESQLDRYVLEKTFIHPASYSAGPDDTLVFDRLTNLPRIEVLLPPGYAAIAANPGAAIDAAGPRQRVTMESFGATRIHVVMKKSAAPAP